MAGDLVRFVDSIAASPTVRLDLNDETSWWVRSFKAPPPRLRRSQSSNAMRDGIYVGSSSYGERTLTVELETRKSTQDLGATEIQKLWRELDRADNYLMYQPTGATKPVFFRLFRSDSSTLEDVIAQAAMRTITVELLAEPFALGLKESLGPYTVNNDPAAGSNPCYVDLPTILGDVPADFVYWDSASGGSTYMSRVVASHSGTSAAVTGVAAFTQAESMSLGTDTTNPGGGPDAAMSGAGTNNFRRTSFATNAALIWRVLASSVTQPAGAYRIFVAVRRSGTTSTIQVRGSMSALNGGWLGDLVTLENSTSRQLVDLGVVNWPDARPVGYAGVNGQCVAGVYFEASRVGGSDTLDWDAAIFVPAGGQNDSAAAMMLVQSTSATSSTGRLVLDGLSGQAFKTSTVANPTTTAVEHIPVAASGGFPRVSPNASNRLYVVSWHRATGSAVAGVTTTTTVDLAYWPRYLFVRPVST